MSATSHPLVETILRSETFGAEFEVPSVLSASLMITWIKWLLKMRGLRGTFRWIRERVEHVPATEAAGIEGVMSAEYNVAMAGALYPARALCLEQSLTLYYLLRRRGVAVKFCHGVQPHPIAAHAWVEYRGNVINDVSEHVNWYALLPQQLP